MARGNRQQRTFLDDDDRRFWLAALSEACGRSGLVNAWVLLDNHCHLLRGPLIAEHLHTKSAANVSQNLRRHKASHNPSRYFD